MDSKIDVRLPQGLIEQVRAASLAFGVADTQYVRNSISEFMKEDSELRRLVLSSVSPDYFKNLRNATSSFSEELSKATRHLGGVDLSRFRIRIPEDTLEAFRKISERHGATLSLLAERIACAALEMDGELIKPSLSEVIEDPTASPDSILRFEVTAPSLQILRRLIEKGVNIAELQWRQFEELVAELLEREGYSVELGRGTKDGGADIFAKKIIAGIGPVLSVWQAKHSKNPVGIATIRELADTRNETKASKGVIVTSSWLTRGALDRIQQDQYLLGKIDGADLDGWMRRTTPSFE